MQGLSKKAYRSELLSRVDGRTLDARRLKDLLRAYESEFCVRSERDRSLVRQAANLALMSEKIQAKLAAGEHVDTDTSINLAGQLRRTLADLERRTTTAQTSAPVSILDLVASAEGD